MKNPHVSLLLLMGISGLASAKTVCQMEAVRGDSMWTIPGQGYWMQTAGPCRVTYTAVGGVFAQMYNTCERKSEDITRHIDPVAVPGTDGELYTHPVRGLSFYKMKDTLAKKPQAVYSDQSFQGDYQSIGLLSQQGDQLNVRVIMGSEGGTFREYSIEKKSDGDFDIKPSSPVKPACKNLPSGGLDRELPILSRDGQYIAGREYNSRKTKIFKMDSDGTCQAVFTIPSQTGKVTFSYDNKHVAYRINDPRTNNGRVMELDLGSGQIKALTTPNEDAQYMVYKPGGKLLYTRFRPGLQSQGAQLVEIDPSHVPRATTPAAKNAEAIGYLWGKACDVDLDADAAAAIGSRLTETECRNLVNGAGPSASDNAQKVPIDDLLAACRTASAPGQSTSSGTTQ